MVCENDIDNFVNFRCKNPQNPIISYYNINSLRYKFTDIQEIVSKSLPDILIISETKLDYSFPNKQFLMENYYEPTRKDNSIHSGGLIEYVRNGIVRKRVSNLEFKSFDSIASELTISKNKWFLLSFYRTEKNEPRKVNINNFFKELSDILNNAFKKYDNVLLIGDINIDCHDKKGIGYNELTEFMDIFGLQNLIKHKTCFFKGHESSIDVMLTNKPRTFLKSKTFELGSSDCHKLIATCLRSHVPRQKRKHITYRSMKNFNNEAFKNELRSNIYQHFVVTDTNNSYDLLLDIVSNTLNKHAPLKRKLLRGNQGRFMDKKLSKAIMKRSNLKSKYNKNPTKSNRDIFKKKRNECVLLKIKAIKNDFHKASTNLKCNTKSFYKVLKPYLSNKGGLEKSDITLVEDDKLVTGENEIVGIFLDYYTNIVKYSSGSPPSNIADKLRPTAKIIEIIKSIEEFYQNHPSIKRIKTLNIEDSFSFKNVTKNDVLKIIKKLDSKKAIGVDNISPKIIKDAAEILAKPLRDIINLSINECIFPTKAKIAAVLPFFKKDDRTNKSNYRPVSVLSAFSKIFERILHNQITTFSDKHLSIYVSAYRKNYSCQHVLVRLIEEWKKGLDNGNLVGAILMDLSKAFDCISHDLLIAKLKSYGFQDNSVKYVYSYLKGRRQCVKLNGTFSKFQTILAGVPQGSILGPILFNIFINDLYYFIKNANLHGFADDHTLSAESKSLNQLEEILCKDTEIALDWLKYNNLIANPSKFQAMILKKDKYSVKTNLKIKNIIIESQDSVNLLGITIDDKLKFDEHIGELCRKSSGLLNAVYRLKRYLSEDARKLAINSFITSNFNYCPLIWNFSSAKSLNKIEMIQKRALRFIENTTRSDYSSLLNDMGVCSMEVNRLRSICIEIFKTINGLNPIYMREIFKKTNSKSERLKFNLDVSKFNQVKFGRNSLRVLGPMLWNSLPNEIKSLKTLYQFKSFIKTWGVTNCPNYNKFKSYFTAVCH